MTEPRDITDNHIDATSYDHLLFDRFAAKNKLFLSTAEHLEKKLPSASGLLQDIFFSLYRHNVQLRNENHVNISQHGNRPFVEHLLNSRYYAPLHHYTAGRKEESLICVDLLARDIQKNINSELAEFLQNEHKFQDQKQKLIEERRKLTSEVNDEFNGKSDESEEGSGDSIPDPGSNPDPSDSETEDGDKTNTGPDGVDLKDKDSIRELLEKAKERRGGKRISPAKAAISTVEKAKEQLAAQHEYQPTAKTPDERIAQINAMLDKLEQQYQEDYEQALGAHNFRANFQEVDITGALAHTIKQIREFKDTLSVWSPASGAEGEEALMGSLEEKLDLFQQISDNPKVRAVTNILGRLKFVALEAYKERTENMTEELLGVKMSNDLPRVLPSEYSYLAVPELNLEFYRKYVEKELLTYAMSGKEKQGKGPIIFCIDESSSMKGERDIASKSLALACMTLAQKEKRDFAVIHFADAMSLRVQIFPNGKATAAQIMDLVNHFFAGGTNFELPLRKAMDIIRSQPKFAPADILFLTDGEDNLRPEFQKELEKYKKQLGFHLFVMLVGDQDIESLSEVADRTWVGLDLKDPRKTGKVLDEVIRKAF